MIHRRHVDQEAAGQRDVTGDARALLADRFLGNLHQNLLAFFQQVGDQRHVALFVAAGAASTATAATAATLGPAIVSRTRRALGIASGARRSANFGAGFGHSRASGFGGQNCFCFRLGFVQFGFVFGFFVNFVGRCYIDLFRGNRFRGKGHGVG